MMETVQQVLDGLEGGWFSNNAKVSQVLTHKIESHSLIDKDCCKLYVMGWNIPLKLLRLKDAAAKKNGGRWKVSWSHEIILLGDSRK